MKKILSSLLAAATLLTTSIPVRADTLSTSSSSDLINIGGYNCYEKSGQYFTIIDGEEYLAIDVRNILPESSDNAVFALESVHPISKPRGWKNDERFTLADGEKHTDTCDISDGTEYHTPVFEITPKKDLTDDYRLRIGTGQWLTNEYTIEFIFHSQWPIDEWLSMDTHTLKFNLFSSNHVIFIGTADTAFDAFVLRFYPLKSNQNYETVFQYDVTPL